MIETRLLEAFVEVVERGSVTDAARVMGRSQPAVSHRLRQLEEALSVQLFEKIGRRLSLTEQGAQLYDEARSILGRLRGLPHLVALPGAALRGEVRVGTFGTLARYVLLDAVGETLDRHPAVKVSVRLGYAEALCASLLAGQLDLLVLIGVAGAAKLDVETIATVRPVAVFAPGAAPTARGEPVTAAALGERRYLCWRGPADPIFDAIDRFAQASGLMAEGTPEIPHIDTLRVLAQRGLGYAILPDYTTGPAAAAGRVCARPIAGLDEAFEMGLLTRAGQPLGPTLAAVCDAIRRAAP